MRKQNVLWKKRIAFLLSAALIFGEIGSNVNIIKAAEVPSNALTGETEKNIEKDIEKTLPVPEDYISLNETEEVEETVPVNGNLKEEAGEDIIPIIGKDDWKVEEPESEVTEEEVNSESTEEPEEMIPSVIPVIGSEEMEVNPVTVDASDVTTPAAITVGDVISRNGYEDTDWEDVTEQFSFTPEEDGYYSLELTQNNGADVQVSVENEKSSLAYKQLYTYNNYTDFISCKLEAGKKYIWNVEYYLDEGDYSFTLEFKKNKELQVSNSQVSGTTGKISSFQYQMEQSGFGQISLESEQGYDYYLSVDGVDGIETYKISNNNPITLFYESTSNITYNLWKNEDAEDKVTLEIQESGSLDELEVYTKENSKKQVVIAESLDTYWYSFTPTETRSYVFVTDGSENETSVSLEIYAKTEGENKLSSIGGSWSSSGYCEIYRLYSNLQAGTTYYVKATTSVYGAIADILVLKDVEGNIENLNEAVTINTFCGADIKCNIPEDGLYEINIQAQKNAWYNLRGGGIWGDWYCTGTAHSEYGYFTKGIQSILIFSAYLIGEDAITVKISPVETESVTKSITMEKSEAWIKYIPEESGYYTIGGILEGDSTAHGDIYKKTADNELSYITGFYKNNDGFEESAYLEKGYEYFVRIYSETVPRNLTVYAQKNEMVEGKLEEQLEFTFSKRCNITIDDLSSGFYEIALEGNESVCSVAFGYAYASESTYNRENVCWFSNKTTKTIYVSSSEDYSAHFFEITKAGIPAENSCKVTIKKVTPTVQELTLGTTVTKTGTANVECYSFTPAETGYYGFNAVGLTEGVYFFIYGDYLAQWVRDSRYLYAGETYYFYVMNQRDKNYSLTFNKRYHIPVYDYNSYNAFIASGGSIGIRDASDITEEMRENDNYSIREVKDGKYIVCSVENFKNKNDIWFLQCAASIDIDENATTYWQIEEDMLIYGHSREEHTYDYHYKYLCDSEGNKLSGSSKLENPYMAYAVYAPVYVPVNSITIRGISALAIGDTTKLTAELDTGINFEPTNSEVTWSSSDNSIVSVDNQGNIKANKAGKAVITCKSQDREGKSGSITIVVPENIVYAAKVVITGATKVNVGSSITLKATIDTAGKGKPTKDGVIWTSSDKKVAKVDANGKVTGVSAGKVTITATSKDGKAKADYTITVKNVNAKKISLNASKITMKKGTTYKWLDVSFSPKNTTNQKIKWKTSNKKVATVDSKGRIKAKGIGKAVITATSSNGKKDTVKVTVTKDSIKTKKIKLSAKKTMKVGETLKLKPVFTPINTTNQRVKWTSSNTKVATVNSKGVVKAKKSGKVTITVTTQDGTKKTAKCKITVKK